MHIDNLNVLKEHMHTNTFPALNISRRPEPNTTSPRMRSDSLASSYQPQVSNVLQDSHMVSSFTGDSLPARLTEENPDWIKEIKASKASITAVKDKSKQIQLPSVVLRGV